MSVVEEFVKKVSDNINTLLEMKNQATQTARRNKDGGYDFLINSDDGKVSEQRIISINADDVKEIASEAVVAQRAFEMAVYAQMDGRTDDEKFANYKKLSEADKVLVDDCARKETGKFEEQARVAILVDQAVAPTIVNNAVNSTFAQAKQQGVLNGNEKIEESLDNGYCAKSLTATLYEMKAKYGGFDFLPSDAEIAAHPQTFINYLQQQPQTKSLVQETKEGQSLRDMFLQNNYQAGAIGFINHGNGHFHAMLYSGEIKNGNPVFISFNNDDASLQLRNSVKGGFVFDLPVAADNQLLDTKEKISQNSNIGNFNKEISITNGKHKIKMNISRKIAEMRENLANRNEQKAENSISKIESSKNSLVPEVIWSKLQKNKIGEKG